jgi:hypothetical protein
MIETGGRMRATLAACRALAIALLVVGCGGSASSSDRNGGYGSTMLSLYINGYSDQTLYGYAP